MQYNNLQRQHIARSSNMQQGGYSVCNTKSSSMSPLRSCVSPTRYPAEYPRPDRGCAARFCVAYRSAALICWEKKLLRKRQRIWPHICDSSRPLLQLPPTIWECHAISLFTAAICSTFVPIRRFQQRLFLFRSHSLYTHDDDDDDDVGHMNGQNGCQKKGF